MGKIIEPYLRTRPEFADSLELLRRHVAGESVEQLALEWQVPRAGISARIRQARRLSEADANGSELDELHSLSARPRMCLLVEGIRTRSQAKAALDAGELQRAPNLGAKSLAEVLQWLSESDGDQDVGAYSCQDVGVHFEMKAGFRLSARAIAIALKNAGIHSVGTDVFGRKLFPASTLPEAWKALREKSESIARQLQTYRVAPPFPAEAPSWEELEKARALAAIEDDANDLQSMPQERGG